MGSVFGSIRAEAPQFKLLASHPSFEIREYGPRLVATLDKASASNNNAFRTLAGYIGVLTAPQNDEQQPIAMTVPVLMTPETTSEQANHMTFMLPASFTLQTAPRPTNSDVKISAVGRSELPAAIVAIRTFSGSASVDTCQPEAIKLFDELDQANLKYTSRNDWTFAAYNSPFTLPFMRTNEIHVKLVDYTIPDES